jgi:hypothetical protein
MKNFVITIMDNPKSVESAERCIKSAGYFGMVVEKHRAYTPADNLEAMLREYKIPAIRFVERFSRPSNCIAAFLSHHSLWKKCVELNEEITIFEHDAYVVSDIPDNLQYYSCINLGAPSYGKFNIPSLGVGALTSKKYFPGAHAYRIKPMGAQALLNVAPIEAGPTDLYLHSERFPFLEEYYPWPVEARDTFTTIQNRNGCVAKHNWSSTYEIL